VILNKEADKTHLHSSPITYIFKNKPAQSYKLYKYPNIRTEHLAFSVLKTHVVIHSVFKSIVQSN